MMITTTAHPLSERSGDALVYFVRERNGKISSCPDRTLNILIKRAQAAGDFSAKTGETLISYPLVQTNSTTPAATTTVRIMVVGLGSDPIDEELLRTVGGNTAQALVKTRATRPGLILPTGLRRSEENLSRHLVEGLILGDYRFHKYQKAQEDDEEKGRGLETIQIHGRDLPGIKKGIRTGLVFAHATCQARDMANEPGNLWTPDQFEEEGRRVAEKYNLTCEVLDRPQMEEMGMGGLLGVSRGSSQPPKLVSLTYRSGKKVPTLLLVGKGLTFDSGGISIKPGEGMADMKYDMCGGAAVLAAMQAIGELQPETLDVVGMIPASENLPGPDALKPGDIITQYNGTTVEVANTDAEGRLILADALAYGIKTYQPDYVIDIATLTGAAIIGLGHHTTALLGNDDTLAEKILKISERCGEPCWRLPLGKEYRKQLKSKVADLKNIGGRPGGTITAACFLEEFVGKTPWVHLDIAGTAWNYTKKSYIPEGPSGVGVRTIIELIRTWAT